MIKRSIDACAEFDIFHTFKRTPEKWRENRENLVRNVETADRGTVMEGKPRQHHPLFQQFGQKKMRKNSDN